MSHRERPLEAIGMRRNEVEQTPATPVFLGIDRMMSGQQL